jgi:2-oxoglutarate ferredoxin oxidoreductase subunit gamma
MRKTERIIIAGFGGQGIMLAGKLVIQAGLARGWNVTFIPSYGAEVRGGTAHCHVIISEDEIASPIIIRPDAVLVMNSPSLDKFAGRVRPGGLLAINSSLVRPKSVRKDLEIVKIPANEIAERLGDLKVANLVLLSAYLRWSRLLSREDVDLTLTTFLPARHRDMLEINRRALRAGHRYEPGEDA